MTSVRFGLFSISGILEEAMAAALRAERSGFVSISPNDHFFSPFGAPSDPQLECFTLLTAIAAKTATIRLMPAVVAASFRPPPLLAKIASTLDHVSGGRLTLGLGAGWLPTEYRAHGYPFPSTRERLDQLGEAIAVVRAMWTEDTPRFRGRFFSIDGAYNQPRPVQKPHPPIMLGGSGTGLLRLAAAQADLVNLIPPTGNGRDFPNDPVATRRFTTEVLLERIEVLKRFAAEAGRDPDTIGLSGLSLVCLAPTPDAPVLREAAAALGFPDLATAMASPVALFGTPEQVCEKVRARSRATGIHYTIVAPSSPESLDLFEREVMPEFRGAEA